MKKVLHVVTIMNRAGLETFIMNLFREIDRTRILFDFLVSLDQKGDFDDEIYKLGGTIYKLGTSRRPLRHLESLFKSYRLYRFLKSHKEYQIVHFHNCHAYSSFLQVFPAKLAGVKDIIVHSHNNYAPHPQVNKIFIPVLNSFSIHRFACSNLAAEWLFGKKSSQCRIVKNGIDPLRFQFHEDDRQRIRKELSLENVPVIIHVGRFNYQKNHKFLLNIFSEVLHSKPNAQLLLIGCGELEHDIIKQIEELKLNDNVKLLGVREDIPALLSASDLFLFPSLFEGLGVVLVEAQANGIPILTINTIAKEAIFSSNLHTFDLSCSSKQWADIAVSLLESKRVDGYSLTTAAGFNMKTVAEDMTIFYNSL